ncbi:hypothetical protein E8L03_10605 [Oceanidesulfovibrio marinus]|uniref:Sulfotransferase domain-containing protein n=2 Tax=Oceanidesulfovibrio marinus TaxID=370038 RepID=A0ABX6NFG4_9BACT|nr:hypothetical protein E8L03_10605 [Oceanidesulfovibrio marinus]
MLRKDGSSHAPVCFHFSSHKCLTAYVGIVMRAFCADTGWTFTHCQGDLGVFEELARSGGRRILSFNNILPTFDGYPPFRASRFLRDPRDLVISAYHYHCWTRETWCTTPHFSWAPITSESLFRQEIEADPRLFPKGVSFQRYLTGLDFEQGVVLEMLWRRTHFRTMLDWPDRPEILTLRYESLVGNEEESFAAILRHYGFGEEEAARGGAIAEAHSLKHKKLGSRRHTRNGAARQWQAAFTPRLARIFEDNFGDVLRATGYESDGGWVQRVNGAVVP